MKYKTIPQSATAKFKMIFNEREDEDSVPLQYGRSKPLPYNAQGTQPINTERMNNVKGTFTLFLRRN